MMCQGPVLELDWGYLQERGLGMVLSITEHFRQWVMGSSEKQHHQQNPLLHCCWEGRINDTDNVEELTV